jgi:hypothetical protein
MTTSWPRTTRICARNPSFPRRRTQTDLEDLPRGSGQPGQDQSFLVGADLHRTGSFQPLPDPVALLQTVDEHELHADVSAIGQLQPPKDLAQRELFLFAPDESGRRQLKNAVHVVVLCTNHKLISDRSTTASNFILLELIKNTIKIKLLLWSSYRAA